MDYEAYLDREIPLVAIEVQPLGWEHEEFSHPAQPVVGVSFFEAQAYCNWLSAQSGQSFFVPSEAQFEAAARGKEGRWYPYSMDFDPSRSNTKETGIGHTTPISIFDNPTPEGVYGLTGNAYCWTRSIYDPKQFPYPYKADDGREDIHSDSKRVLRGGDYYYGREAAKSTFRNHDFSDERFTIYGFRVCCMRKTE